MQVKRVKIGIRSIEDVLDNFVAVGEAIEGGAIVKKQTPGVYFTNLDAFRKALTQKKAGATACDPPGKTDFASSSGADRQP